MSRGERTTVMTRKGLRLKTKSTGKKKNVPVDSAHTFEDSFFSDYDLKSIAGKAIYTVTAATTNFLSPSSKRVKPSPAESSSTQPFILVDSQWNPICSHTHGVCEGSPLEQLTSCEGTHKADRVLGVSQVGVTMCKVITYFAEVLTCRIYGLILKNPIHHS
ncbi:hypothetical protein Ahy_A09g045893 [Arachis hypogaea]|uniref:Uncharacterized protein n=1 Tax=Arachis hypogaea TaxID=3818 RepID=A0A445BND8_ARAHY|nr:hypothetical protein Ahy_A09g045893 [Arachis hypogaea]